MRACICIGALYVRCSTDCRRLIEEDLKSKTLNKTTDMRVPSLSAIELQRDSQKSVRGVVRA